MQKKKFSGYEFVPSGYEFVPNGYEFVTGYEFVVDKLFLTDRYQIVTRRPEQSRQNTTVQCFNVVLCWMLDVIVGKIL